MSVEKHARYPPPKCNLGPEPGILTTARSDWNSHFVSVTHCQYQDIYNVPSPWQCCVLLYRPEDMNHIPWLLLICLIECVTEGWGTLGHW